MPAPCSEKTTPLPHRTDTVRMTLFHLLVFSLLSLCLFLGFWQLERSEEKARMLEQIHQGYQEAGNQSALLSSLLQDQIQNYTHYQLTGRYHPEFSFILDNRTYQGRVGYHLLTLFEILPEQHAAAPEPESHWILVNRGWIAAPRLRSERPVYDTPSGILQINVQLTRLHPVNKTEQLDLKWPVRIQWFKPEQLAELIQQPILPYQFRLTDAHQPGVRIAQPAYPALMPEQHTGYAVQWFSLSLVLSFIWLRFFLFPGLRNRQIGVLPLSLPKK